MALFTPKNSKTIFINIAFLVVSATILTFLLNAPEETTAKLPLDEDHNRFADMKKKEAEAFCQECHFEKGVSPLPEDHPPKYRCLFCHKRT
jgi:cytochrome c553